MRRVFAAAVLLAVPLLTGFQYPFPQSRFPNYQPGYPGYQPGGPVGDEAQFIRSLYNRFLNREPDPSGFRTWMTRLGQIGGNRARLTQEFQRSALPEQSTINPFFPQPNNNPYANPYDHHYGHPHGPNW